MIALRREFSRAAAAAMTLAAMLATAPAAHASGTQAWEMNSYADFVRGRFAGMSLSRDGRLSLAPKLDPIFASGQPVIWSMAEAADGTLYAATGHRGRVYRVDKSGKASLLWTAGQPEVFAVAVDPGGAVYAGTSPDGKVYKIENGKASEYFAPQARYIWALAVGKDGALYVGTGDQGRVYRVTAPGEGELYYETGQSHVTGLAIDSQGRLLAGTEPNGILYRISARDKAFVLYDSELPEIRAIVPMPDGTVYAAALGGSIAKQMQSAAQAAQAGNSGVPSATTAMTVTVEAQAQNPEVKPPDPRQPAQPAAPPAAAGTAAQAVSQVAPAVEVSGVDKSAVYRINPDNTVETLWTSKEENVYDLLALERQVLFSTDVNGRIYGIMPDRRLTLVAETREGETTRLLPSDHSVLAATADGGRIFRLGETPGGNGSYEAPVHDSGSASRWGSVSWHAELPAGCTVAFYTRSGNSAKPDRTWSDWSGPLENAAGSAIASPNARFIQWKVDMAGTNGITPRLDSVSLAYLPQNSPPVIKGITVVMLASPAVQAAKASGGSAAAFTVTVTDSGDAPATSAGTPTQTLTRASNQQVTVTWQAEDPDGDRLLYSLYFRGEDQNDWLPLKKDTHDNSITFDSDIMADGRYYFRVIASDRESNPPPSAREAQITSAPILIDNTPPAITIGQVRYGGGTAHVEWEAADAASSLRRAEYSLDATGWIPVPAADGVIDSLRERFALDLTGLAPGEHLLVIRAADSADNIGVRKVILR